MLFQKIFSSRMGQFREFPGPPPSFPFGNLLQFVGGRWPWQVCAELGRDYGPITCVWFANKPALILNDPGLIGEVLDTRWSDFYKHAPCAALAPVITRSSLFISNPPAWKQARGENPLSVVPFTQWFPGQLEAIGQSIRKSLQSLIAKAGSIDMYTQMQRLSFQAFAVAFWGRELPDRSFDWFQALARMGDKRMKMPAQVSLPLNPFFYSARRSWYEQFESLVADARRTSHDATCDLLTSYLRTGASLSDSSLAEALATNFFGGVFSCSSTVNSALYLLAQHAEQRAQLIDALRDTLANGETWDLPSLESCQHLDFVLRETMRYYPAVPIYFRNAAKQPAVQLGEHEIPGNTLLLISNWYLHKFSDHWGDPERFRPDRWDDGVAEANPAGSDYFFPFGRGPRMCIGSHFAIAYMKLALATILLETQTDMDPAQPYKQNFFFGVMMPKLRASFSAA